LSFFGRHLIPLDITTRSREFYTIAYSKHHSQRPNTMASNYTDQNADKVKEAHSTLYAAGHEMRNKVAGKEYVDLALSNATSDFARPMQEVHPPLPSLPNPKAYAEETKQLATEAAWGSIWTRPGLDLKTRSLLNIAMLCALNRGPELAVHTRGALNNGATEVEIREVILQAAVYAGMPAGMEGTKVAEKAINEWKEKQKQ
jgi:4-carboxymuconolactone decarboxylase